MGEYVAAKAMTYLRPPLALVVPGVHNQAERDGSQSKLKSFLRPKHGTPHDSEESDAPCHAQSERKNKSKTWTMAELWILGIGANGANGHGCKGNMVQAACSNRQ